MKTTLQKTMLIATLALFGWSNVATAQVLVKGNPLVGPAYLKAANSTLFFNASDGTNGPELWKSDGTTSGTSLVKDIVPGAGGSTIALSFNLNGTLFFKGGPVTEYELWKSDGTDTGTVMVKNINSGSSSSPGEFTDVNGTLFFAVSDGTNGRELWKSDGTDAGTVMVKDINSGSGNGNPNEMININGTLYFRVTDGVTGFELWKSDGTAAGTVMVKDISSGSSSYPDYLTNFNGTLYFAAAGNGGAELWKSDGTDAGTILVKDIFSGSQGGTPSEIINVGGTLFFYANTSANGIELWKSDGTTNGTVLVKDLFPGASNSNPSQLIEANGTLYFNGTDGTNGRELWKSDGTDAGTVMVKDINPGSGNALTTTPTVNNYLLSVNGMVYFAATNGTTGTELWKSDGTDAGTVMLAEINPGTGNSDPSFLTNLNGTVLFAANSATGGPSQLWKYDGITGISFLSQNEKFIIYPNPTSGKFTINCNENINSVEVYNIIGEKMYSSTNQFHNLMIDLSYQQNGIYFIQIQTANGVISEKIVINK